ncbi:MAG TPA: YMGG-like glycine zipper-containing protein [Dissulfurispiraceae bacterium]|nr:YMGG-like glycine zipper-containing protein [Dissulfurispiraceae bacterium]
MKRLIIFITVLAMAAVLMSCTESQVRGGGIGAGVGGVAGALLDHRNPWRGGVIGAALGGTFGATLGDISDRASREAVQANKPVYYRTEDGRGEYRAEPAGYNDATRCKKIHEKVWEEGRLIRDHVKEVCEGERYDRRY